MSRLSILYDGWAIAHQPNHPAAIHLLTLLHYHPADLPASIALPALSLHPIPESISSYLIPTKADLRGRLDWEQRILPNLSKQVNAACLHLTSPYPPLFGSAQVLVSPCEYLGDLSLRALPTERGLTAHLRTALGQGGLSRARAILWPDDLPDPGLPAPKVPLPPVVHPAFLDKKLDRQLYQNELVQALDLPDTYILYQGPGDRNALEELLAAWSWAAGPLGDNYPLLILGLNPQEQALCTQLATTRDLQSTIHTLPALSIEALAALYHNCSAVFHPTLYSAWSGAARAALICEKPLVALETPALSALVGPAAYLVPLKQATSSRALGAALITVVVEESVGEELAQAARKLTSRWSGEQFGKQLAQIYQSYY